jgi:hypothetical protein
MQFLGDGDPQVAGDAAESVHQQWCFGAAVERGTPGPHGGDAHLDQRHPSIMTRRPLGTTAPSPLPHLTIAADAG